MENLGQIGVEFFLDYVEKCAGSGCLAGSYEQICGRLGIDSRLLDGWLEEYFGWRGEEILGKYAICPGSSGKVLLLTN